MTREEAVDWIRRLIVAMKEETSGDFSEPEYKDDVYEALDMAIEMLKQQPCEDCISRQAVLDTATTIQTDDFSDNEIIEIVTVEEIKELPSVTPQPKTGHWIHFALSDDCSECGWSTGKYISPSKYCPNCGAKMVEPQEGGDKE